MGLVVIGEFDLKCMSLTLKSQPQPMPLRIFVLYMGKADED